MKFLDKEKLNFSHSAVIRQHMIRIYKLTFFFFFLFLASNQAQLSLDNSYFPVAGDTLTTVVTVTQVGEIPITGSGDNQLWDFSNVTGGIGSEIVYREYVPSDTVDLFPEATLVITGSDGTTFIRSTETSFDILGLEGLDPTGFGLNLVSRINPPLPQRSAPLDFLDFNTYSSSSNVSFGADLLPPELFDGLPFAPDSLRVLINIDVVDLVDARGTVLLPTNVSYETIRQKRVQYSESRLEVKVPLLDWVDVTDQFAGGANGGGFLGVDTTITYTHWAQGVKEPIALLTLDSEEENVVSFEYKSDDPEITSTANVTSSGYENVYAYPNPAINFAKFDCVNLKPDYYELKIYNILGLEAFSVRNFISGNKMIQVDLSDFKKGAYLYSLVDTTGRVITTKRLVVIRP